MNHDLGMARCGLSQPDVSIATNLEPCMIPIAEATKKQRLVSVCNIRSRISHSCYGRVERRAVLLESHICIAQSCCRF